MDSFNLSDSSPAAPANAVNAKWQRDTATPPNISASVPIMTGDAGAGGTVGLVPAPLAGSYEAQMFLRADGNWAIPPTPQGSFAVEINGTEIASTANAGAAFEIRVNGNVVAQYSA